jgi:hypothetical protein
MTLYKEDKSLRLFHAASIFSVIAAVFVIWFAARVPGSYSVYNQYLLSQAKGQDIVTLCLIVPLMILAIIFSLRKSAEATLFLAGCLGYMFYTYVTFSYLTYARLSFIYIAIYSMSLFGLIDFFININYSYAEKYLKNKSVNTVVSIYNVIAGTLFSLIWIKDLSYTLFTGIIPYSVKLNNGASAVYANDIGFFLPAILLASVLLFRKSKFGFILTSVVLVKQAMLGLAVLGMIYFMSLDKQPVQTRDIIPFVVITMISTISTVAFYSQLMRKKKAETV